MCDSCCDEANGSTWGMTVFWGVISGNGESDGMGSMLSSGSVTIEEGCCGDVWSLARVWRYRRRLMRSWIGVNDGFDAAVGSRLGLVGLIKRWVSSCGVRSLDDCRKTSISTVSHHAHRAW